MSKVSPIRHILKAITWRVIGTLDTMFLSWLITGNAMLGLKVGLAEKTFEIKDLAELLFVSPKHLSNTIQEVLGKSPCDIYEERLIEISKELLLTTNKPISHIAQTLTFDPSNFTKFFKSFEFFRQ